MYDYTFIILSSVLQHNLATQSRTDDIDKMMPGTRMNPTLFQSSVVGS